MSKKGKTTTKKPTGTLKRREKIGKEQALSLLCSWVGKTHGHADKALKDPSQLLLSSLTCPVKL